MFSQHWLCECPAYDFGSYSGYDVNMHKQKNRILQKPGHGLRSTVSPHTLHVCLHTFEPFREQDVIYMWRRNLLSGSSCDHLCPELTPSQRMFRKQGFATQKPGFCREYFLQPWDFCVVVSGAVRGTPVHHNIMCEKCVCMLAVLLSLCAHWTVDWQIANISSSSSNVACWHAYIYILVLGMSWAAEDKGSCGWHVCHMLTWAGPSSKLGANSTETPATTRLDPRKACRRSAQAFIVWCLRLY